MSSSPRFYWAILALSLAYGCYASITEAWVCDDAFISFRYARNLAEGRGLVFNTNAAPVEGYTNFLWTVLLALGIRLGIDPVAFGLVAGVALYLATIALLGRCAWQAVGARALPVAAGGLALHVHTARFASCGLETMLFTFLVTLGLVLAIEAKNARAFGVTGLALILATMTRPDGAILYALTLAFVARLAWGRRRLAPIFAYMLPLVLVYAPYFAWKWSYYGDPLPNTYYAKSGGRPYWSAGLYYLRLYFQWYWVLIPALCISIALIWTRSNEKAAPGWNSSRAPFFVCAFVMAYMAYVARVGGDFMFARFCLPVTPALLLGWQLFANQSVEWSRLTLATLVVGLWLAGHTPDEPRMHVVEERHYYPESFVRESERIARHVSTVFKGTDVVVATNGGQAVMAYYGSFPTVIERHGLTDVYIAHRELEKRGRVGHEKFLPLADPYFSRRGTDFVMGLVKNDKIRGDRIGTEWRRIEFRVPGLTHPYIDGEWFCATLLTYDRSVLRVLDGKRGVRYRRFETRLDEYLATIDGRKIRAVERDFAAFEGFYFDHTHDPKRRRAFVQFLRAAKGGV